MTAEVDIAAARHVVQAQGRLGLELERRIAELEARERLAIEALCKVATAELQWEVCRDIAKVTLGDLGVKID